MTKASLLKRLETASALLAEEIAHRGPDPLAGLSIRQREFILHYRKTTDQTKQFVDCIEGTDPVAVLLNRSCLNADCSEAEAQEAYHREIEACSKWHSRRDRKGVK